MFERVIERGEKLTLTHTHKDFPSTVPYSKRPRKPGLDHSEVMSQELLTGLSLGDRDPETYTTFSQVISRELGQK